MSTGSDSSTNMAATSKALGGKAAITASPGAYAVLPQNSFTNGILFDNIIASENLAEIPEYRCIYLENSQIAGATPFLGAKIYVAGNTYAKFALGKAQAKNIEASVIPDETTPPSLIVFNTYDKSNKLNLGDLNPGERIAIWIRRTPQNVGGHGTTTESLDLVVEGSQ